jgi:hypothetical protein
MPHDRRRRLRPDAECAALVDVGAVDRDATDSRCGLHTRTVTVCRDRYPKASDTSSPPCLLRSLPAGAVAGWGLHPLEKRRLVTAHVVSGHSPRWAATLNLENPRGNCGASPSSRLRELGVAPSNFPDDLLCLASLSGHHLQRVSC